MKFIVTGSAGHLGEALCRTLIASGHGVTGIDVLSSPFTTHQGSITDKTFLSKLIPGTDAILHTATLHKPHVSTHSEAAFIDVNLHGTLTLLQLAAEAGVQRFVFTSTTSVFGDALIPPSGTPAAWITEEVTPIPKNIYGVTKAAAEDLCQLYHRNHGLNCIVLRTSRFFPEQDDDKKQRDQFADENLKANEYLYRRVDLSDVVSAHLLAAEKAPAIGFGKYIISATTPVRPDDLVQVRTDAPSVIKQYFPDYADIYSRRGWKMMPRMDRIYVNHKAVKELGWQPQFDFRHILDRVAGDKGILSDLALQVGSKGYHAESFEQGPYPVG